MEDFSSRVIVFTDIHFGIHSNASSYIDICSKTMSWILDYALENSVRDIIFMGDYFDSRASIDVKTLNSATESLYSIADSGIRISLILGNHDIYLRDSTSIHSLFAFNGHNGIKIVDKPYVYGNMALIPWQYGVAKTNEIEISENLKYVFCHHNFPVDFFIGGAGKRKRNSDSFVNSKKYEDDLGIQNGIVETVIRNGGTIFSGHIHKNMEIPIGSNSVSKLIIGGSPYETNWGFGNSKCGLYDVDMESGNCTFVENPNNKRHVEIRTSRFESDFDGVDFENSIVRLNVDTQESFDAISKMQSKIHSMNPFLVENTKYEFTVAEFNENGATAVNGNPTDSLIHGVASKLDYVKSAIDNADFSKFSYLMNSETKTIDKDRLKEIATVLFERN